MRLAVIMARKSPWSRELVSSLLKFNYKIQLICFARPSTKGSYLTIHDEFQASSIDSLCKSVDSLSLLESSSLFGMQYFTCIKKLKEILKICKAEALLTLYGGGFATMA